MECNKYAVINKDKTFHSCEDLQIFQLN